MNFLGLAKRCVLFSRENFNRFIWPLFHRYCDQYAIPGTRNLNRNIGYTNPKLEPKFQDLLESFKSEVLSVLKQNSSRTYFKFGDGDYFFLRGIGIGSAAPGNRAISRQLKEDELATFIQNSRQADSYMCEIATENRALFKETFGNIKVDFPAEIVYGLVANRWILKIPNIRIGLIGAEEKLSLIKHLLEFEDYRKYLGLKKFYNYVTIPQKFACDDLPKRLEEIREGLEREHCDLYLVGIGHLKSGVLAKLVNFSNSVFVDIGSGIDALAGIIDRERPYFGDWVNFRSRSFDYDKLDFLQYKKSKVKFLN